MTDPTPPLPAGRDLDAEIARRVFGMRITEIQQRLMHDAGGHCWTPVPHYSTDIAAAWAVVEELRNRGLALALGKRRGIDKTACYAICLAALRAVAGESPIT